MRFYIESINWQYLVDSQLRMSNSDILKCTNNRPVERRVLYCNRSEPCLDSLKLDNIRDEITIGSCILVLINKSLIARVIRKDPLGD